MDRDLLKKSNLLEPIMTIGKNGLTENAIKDIKNHLKNRKIIKVKMLKSYIEGKDKKILAAEVAEKTNSEIIKRVGFVVTLAEKEE